MTDELQPIIDADPVAKRAQDRIRAQLVASWRWDEGFETTLQMCVLQVARYWHLRRAGVDANDPALVEVHQSARAWLAEFLEIPQGRDHVYPVDENGDDANISALVRE